MSKPITDLLYGEGSTNLLLRKPWSPSTLLPPTDFSEGFVYIAENEGDVDLGNGVETYLEGDSIVYKDGVWQRFGSSSSGGGLEPWTPDSVQPPLLPSLEQYYSSIVTDVNGATVTATGWPSPSHTFIYGSEGVAQFDNVERGFYFTLTDMPVLPSNNQISAYSFFIDGSPHDGSATAGLGLVIERADAADAEYTVYIADVFGNGGGSTPITIPRNDMEGQVICMSMFTDGTDYTVTARIGGTSNAPLHTITFTTSNAASGLDLSVINGYGNYITIDSVPDNITTTITAYHPVSPSVTHSAVTQLLDSAVVDENMLPEDGSYIIEGLTTPLSSSIGEVDNGVMVIIHGDDLSSKTGIKEYAYKGEVSSLNDGVGSASVQVDLEDVTMTSEYGDSVVDMSDMGAVILPYYNSFSDLQSAFPNDDFREGMMTVIGGTGPVYYMYSEWKRVSDNTTVT